MMTKLGLLGVLAVAGVAQVAQAQQTTFVYRLGRDTMAIETFTRSGNRVTGEVVTRGPQAVNRLQYEVTLGNDGRPTALVYRSRTAAGTPPAGAPTEIRYTFFGDSARREATFPDSVSRRVFAAVRAVPFQQPAYGLLEIAFALARRANQPNATFATIGTMGVGGNPGTLALTISGDTARDAGGRMFVIDREGRIQRFDASATTQKWSATRSTDRVDLSALATRMQPTGTLSGRGAAHASFLQSVVFINYGRPMVRERTVWGGTLVPYDEVWRTGANEATHLATTRELTFGNVIVPPGLYTLWIHNARSGPQLAINKQIGQWGAGASLAQVYNPANDVGRVPLTMAATPEHVEEFTITIRNLTQPGSPPPRGAIDFAWGDKVVSAAFTVR